ncbi:MAG: glycoside hydrolase family 13 protein [Bacteroidota bacterium]
MASLPWYHKTTIYQIYPRSFYDSNGDGIGDIPGIIQKLDYIQELGFETIWTSPFYASPQADFGYDISDYNAVASEYGTIEDVSRLIEEVHRRRMRIVFDMVMNHTSIEHAWFGESRSSRDNPKADWYIWRDKPNNWQSMTGGSGWHYARERKQYYWASFLPFQPDLNYRIPDVKEAMFDVVRFWLARGVDGFRLDLFNVIFKDHEFRNNPFSLSLIPSEDEPSSFFQSAKYTLNLPESFIFAREFRSVCDEFGEKLSIGEVSGGTKTIRNFLGEEKNDGLTLVFDFWMLDFKFTEAFFHDLIQEMEQQYPHPFMPVYVFSNHDKRRSIDRLGNDRRKARLLHTLQLTVRGVPCMYYGEEIGMANNTFPVKTALDPIPHKFRWIPRFVFDLLGLTINRDEVRTPMQWNEDRNAGFSTAVRTWLPVHENHTEINVATEAADENSLLTSIRSLMKIRGREQALQEGSLTLVDHLPKNVLGYTRIKGNEKIFVLLNFEDAEKDFHLAGTECLVDLRSGRQLSGNRILLEGYGALILKEHC